MLDNLVKNALVPLLLRLGLAAVFLYHGIDMIVPVKHAYGTNWRPAIDVPGPLKVPAQAAVAWGQVLAAVALALGVLPRVAAGGLILILAGCIATVTSHYGFKSVNQGWEYDFVLIIMCVAVFLLGGGPIGVGHWLGGRRRKT